MNPIRIISASAGSGKTSRLAKVLEEEVASGRVRAQAILATTFTNKAAAELQERVRVALLSQGRIDEAQRLAAARVGTINAVCGQLVKDFAFELGLSPNLQVLDEALADETLRRALATAATAEEVEELTSLRSRLELLDWSKAVQKVVDFARTNRISVDAFLDCMRRSTEGFAALLGKPARSGQDLDRALVKALKEFLERSSSSGDQTKTTQDARARVQVMLSAIQNGRRLAWSDWLRLANLKTAKASAELAQPIIQAASMQDRHPELARDVNRAIELVFAIAARALAAYQAQKRAWMAIDFVDQEAYALQLLEREEVRERLREELDLVLVDEFQDTSPLQLAIFMKLSELARQSVWVGDQKQAIFGFRGTDPALMDAALEQILGKDEPETLGRSWRSRPALVEVTSALFAEAFSLHGMPPSRVKLTAARKEPKGLGPVLERWRLASKNKGQDALAAASAVRELLADPQVRVRDPVTLEPRPPRPGDIAVLCRKNETCAIVASALETLDIRAVLPRPGVLSTPEGCLAMVALRLWIDGRDTLAAAEIARLLHYPEDENGFLGEVIERKGKDCFIELPEIVALTQARQKQPLAGAVAAFDAAMDAVNLREHCLRWGDAPSRLANLDALRAHAVSYSARCDAEGAGCTPAGLVAHLYSLAAEKTDTQAVLAREDAVVVSTWHKAKGLEWPIVVLFELEKTYTGSPLGVQAVSDRAGLDLSAPLAGRWIRFWPDPYGPRQTKAPFHARLDPGSCEAARVAQQREEYQELRLLYVGWTRARDRLVLATRTDQLGKGLLSRLQGKKGFLLTEPDKKVTWAGQTLSVAVREAAPGEPVARSRVPGEGYVPSGPAAHPPAYLQPSTISEEGSAGAPERIGEAIAVGGSFEPVHLGDACHGFLAADMPGLGPDERRAMAQGLLERWCVSGALTPEQLVLAADALRGWVQRRWPGAEWRRELTLRHCLEGGTVMRGSADLVLEMADGLVVIDHKTLPGSLESALEKAAHYAGQLRAYADTLQIASGRPVLGCYVHLPLSGVVVPVEIKGQ